MLDDIKKFYERTKLDKFAEGNEDDPAPFVYSCRFYKEYPRLLSIPLSKDNDKGELKQLLEIRKSTRTFSDKPLEFEELSKILRSCRILDLNRDPEKRTYPSGGARFPVELYLISFNIDRLIPGAYHYNIKKESLELLLDKDLKSKRRELISPYLENPAATVIFTSVLARSEVKYGLRAYPYSLIEAGHMGQNIHLACAEQGIGSCSVSGFIDNSVRDILDLTENEIPIYTISIGWEKRS